ncbi:hypothetical protein [Streptomyces sp. NPDC047315]|uniref:hypothetical protein n=1 Tax=Streptomyces sp. NPDC047315 TaxID=3155142 RepID=UPI0033F19794
MKPVLWFLVSAGLAVSFVNDFVLDGWLRNAVDIGGSAVALVAGVTLYLTRTRKQ